MLAVGRFGEAWKILKFPVSPRAWKGTLRHNERERNRERPSCVHREGGKYTHDREKNREKDGEGKANKGGEGRRGKERQNARERRRQKEGDSKRETRHASVHLRCVSEKVTKYTVCSI